MTSRIVMLPAVVIATVQTDRALGMWVAHGGLVLGSTIGAAGLVSWRRLPDDQKADWEEWRKNHVVPRMRHLRARRVEK